MIKRHAIINKVVTLLSAITTTGGYKNNFPTAVIWDTDIKIKDSTLKCIVRDMGNRFEDDGRKQYLIIEVEVSCTKGSSNYQTIAEMIDDVYKCLYTNELTISNLYGKVEIFPQQDIIELEQFDKETATAKITFEFFHTEDARWRYDSTNYS
jgi:hypothetical protein